MLPDEITRDGEQSPVEHYGQHSKWSILKLLLRTFKFLLNHYVQYNFSKLFDIFIHIRPFEVLYDDYILLQVVNASRVKANVTGHKAEPFLLQQVHYF